MLSDSARERIQLYQCQEAIRVNDYSQLLREVMKSYSRKGYIISGSQRFRTNVWHIVQRDLTTVGPNMTGYLRTGQQIRVMGDELEPLLGLSSDGMVILVI